MKYQVFVEVKPTYRTTLAKPKELWLDSLLITNSWIKFRLAIIYYSVRYLGRRIVTLEV